MTPDTCSTGLFFGSFNPVHNGHVALAEYILAHSALDEVWFVVSPCSPFKTHLQLAAEEHRLNMVNLAIAGHKSLKACDVEFCLPKPSYTVDTLRRLSALYPERKFTLIMGEDNLRGFDRWKEAACIAQNYSILVYPRSESTNDTLLRPDLNFSDLQVLCAPLLPISSTEIRQLVAQYQDTSRWLHPDVAAYIARQQLYA